MISKCPFCSYSYEVTRDGKFQCGVCGTKYYLAHGKIIVSGHINRYGAEGVIVDRYRVLGELFPGSDDVIYCCVDELLGNLVCLRDSRPEEGYAKSNRNRFIPVGEIAIPRKSVVNSETNGTAGVPNMANIVSIADNREEKPEVFPAPAPVIPAAPAPVAAAPAPVIPAAPAPVAAAPAPVIPAAPAPVAAAPAPVAAVESAPVELSLADPAAVDPAWVEPAAVDPAAVDPAWVEPAAVEPVPVAVSAGQASPLSLEPKASPLSLEPKASPLSLEPKASLLSLEPKASPILNLPERYK